MIKDKIIQSRIFEFDGHFSIASFYSYTAHICGEMDIPVPVVLKKHSRHFDSFKNTRFRAGDFVEQVSFDCMVFEHMPEGKKDNKKKGGGDIPPLSAIGYTNPYD